MKEKDLITSTLGRALKLGSLLGIVGTSVFANRVINIFRSTLSREIIQSKTWQKNAVRIVNTLGKMKGGAMKIGQMLAIIACNSDLFR